MTTATFPTPAKTKTPDTDHMPYSEKRTYSWTYESTIPAADGGWRAGEMVKAVQVEVTYDKRRKAFEVEVRVIDSGNGVSSFMVGTGPQPVRHYVPAPRFNRARLDALAAEWATTFPTLIPESGDLRDLWDAITAAPTAA